MKNSRRCGIILVENRMRICYNFRRRRCTVKTYNYRDCDCRICGLYGFEKGGRFERLDSGLLEKLPHLAECSGRPAGARLLFATDTERLYVKIKLSNVYPDRGMSFYQANVANLFAGSSRKNMKYMGIVTSDSVYDENEIYAGFDLTDNRSEILVFLPRNPHIEDIEITVDDGARIFPPEEYENVKPVLFYGSSITENGHTSSANAYPALLSRWFNVDYYNFGFSGKARGESEMMEYLSQIDTSVFVYDYDHNAPDAAHLYLTHKKGFEIFRSRQPGTPVIITTKPHSDDGFTRERRDIIYETYLSAVRAGDENVYFIDGLSYFDGYDREICTTDRTHPNDLGHYLMALKLAETFEQTGLKRKIKF